MNPVRTCGRMGSGSVGALLRNLEAAKRLVLLVALAAWFSLAQAGQQSYTAGTSSWPVPVGVSSVVVEVWGAGGGGGGQNLSSDGGGGGGGGAYMNCTLAGVSGSYTVSVGAGGAGGNNASTPAGGGGTGGDSYFGSAATVLAKGGVGGRRSTGTPPPGGAGGAAGSGACSGTNNAAYSGGNGGTGRNSTTGRGAPGGSSAGTAANGTSGPTTWSTATAAAPPAGGGIGGNGGNTNGQAGFAPASGNGGGGGGSAEGANIIGGIGAAGKVVITWYPKVSSINRVGASPTTNTTVSWTVTFSENVTGVDVTDFALAQTGGVTGATMGTVTGSGTTYTVTANTGTVSATGTLGLNLVDDDSIIDAFGNPLGGPGAGNGNFTGAVYTINPVNCTSQVNGNWNATGTWTNCRGGLPLAGDTVTIAGGTTVTQNINSPAISTLTISGTLNNAASTLTVNSDMIINVGGTYTGGSGAASIAGNFTNSGTFTSGSGTWTFNGSSSQSITGSATFTRLAVNNAGGITLNNNVTVSTLLTLTSGSITTGSSTLITSANCPGSISIGSGFVEGNLQLRFASGIQTCTFPVGTGTTYAPITVTTPSGSAGGKLTGSTTGNEHPNIATSGIDSTHDANRYWTLGAASDTIVAGTYAITFNFIAGDLDAAATPGNFIIGQYDGSTWTLPTSITATSTSTQSTNIVIAGASFNTANSFVVGEKVFVCTVPADLPAGMSCQCDNFNRASVNPSTIFGGNYTLYANAAATGWPKIVTSGLLQMTANAGNYATSATLPGTFPAAGNIVAVEFRHYAYRTGGGAGADGMAVTLSDSAVAPAAGAFGGSLGYAQKTAAGGGGADINGFAGGWIGVGIDEWGNFSAATEGRVGGIGQTAESVAVRGSGALLTGYPYLGGTANLGASAIDNTNSATPAQGYAYRVQVDARCYQNSTAGLPAAAPNDCATLNPSAAKYAWVSVYRDTTGAGTFNTGNRIVNFEAYSTAQAQSVTQADIPSNWKLSYTGSTGGSTNVHELGSLKVCGQTFVPPAGYSIQVNNLTPTTCPSDPRPTVTVKPLNSNGQVVTTYTNTVTLSAKLLGGGNPAGTVTWALTTGGGVFTPTGNGTATYHYVTADNGVASFSLDDNTQEALYINVTETPGTLTTTLGTPVQFSSGVASFVIGYPDTLGIGVVAGRAHLMSITRNKSTCGGGTDTTYTGSKALDGWYAPAGTDHPSGALAPQVCATNVSGTCLPTTGACQTLSIAPPAEDPNSNNMPALTFTNGVANFCLATSDVGKYAVNLRDDSVATGTPSVTGASVNLTARPFAVVVSNVVQGATSNPGNNTSGGAVFASAGTAFSATVAGYLWSSNGSSNQGNGDTNGDGVPDAGALSTQVVAGGLASHYADAVTLTADNSLAANFAPTGLPGGTLSGGSVTVAGGSGSTSALSYNEVGSFTLKATPASTYLNTAGVDLRPGVVIFSNPLSTSQNQWVGRFKPDHFTLSSGTLTNRGAAACSPASSFTYLGEGLDLTFTLTAEQLGGGATTNYTGAYAKLDPTVFSNYAVGARSGTTDLTSRISGIVTGSPAWMGGVLNNITLRTAVARAASPDGPWTGTQFGIAPNDGEGTVLTTLDFDVDGVGGNDHAKVGGTTELRFGVLKLDNAYGSELLPIRVPVRAMYWNGSSWQTNADDNCTSFGAVIATLSNYKAPPSGTALAPGNFSIASNWTSGTVTLGTTPAASGTANIVLSKPSPTATGSVDLTLDLTSALPWLRGTWSSVGTAWQQNPAVRLNFGASRSPFIYLREMY